MESGFFGYFLQPVYTFIIVITAQLVKEKKGNPGFIKKYASIKKGV
jgi:hypothetical protein